MAAGKSDLWTRIGSAIILFAIAGTALWFGGLAFGLLLLVAAGSATAQEAARREEFDKRDTNNDGRLTQAEYGGHAGNFEAMDCDKNGTLSEREFVDRYLVSHEFVKRLHERYARERIEIPFPQRVVHVSSWGPFESGLVSVGPSAAHDSGRRA